MEPSTPQPEKEPQLERLGEEIQRQVKLGVDLFVAKLATGRDRVIVTSWIFFAVSAATIALVFFFVRGVIGLFAAISGSGWFGDLAGSALLGLLLAGTAWTVRTRRQAAKLAYLREKYEDGEPPKGPPRENEELQPR